MILLTGATGFTGSFVVENLLNRGLPFCCLIRNEKVAKEFRLKNIPVVLGDVNDPNSYNEGFQKCDGLLNIVSLNQHHIPLALAKAREFKIQRVVFISTTAIFTKLKADSKAMRMKYEEAICTSGLNWSIVRPTMIFGAPGDRNIERLIKAVKRFPIHPILGSGRSLIQPVHVTDLAHAIVEVFTNEKTYNKAITISGKSPLSYRESVRVVSKVLKKKTLLLPLPVTLAIALVEVCRRVPGLPNIQAEQVLRLNEDKSFDHEDAIHLFKYSPMSFESGIRYEVEKIGAL